MILITNLINKRRRKKFWKDEIRRKEEKRITAIFALERDSLRELYYKDLQRADARRKNQIDDLEKAYKKLMDKKVKEARAESDREIGRLRAENESLRKKVKNAQKAYEIYRDYSDAVYRVADDLVFASERLFNRHSESHQSMLGLKQKMVSHDRNLRKIHPKVTKLLELMPGDVSEVEAS